LGDVAVQCLECCAVYGLDEQPKVCACGNDYAKYVPLVATPFEEEYPEEGKALMDMCAERAGRRASGDSVPKINLDTWRPAGAHKVGRNDPCPCGSGRKAKKCCGTRDL
jgi:hypothetical protein